MREPLQAWHDTLAETPEQVRRQVFDRVDPAAEAHADGFYTALLAHGEASKMLDHDLVNRRLRASMAKWLRGLFSGEMSVGDIVARQQHIGEVHARIGVPIDLVAVAARVLKRAITSELCTGDLARDQLPLAIQYVHEMIDLAIDAMNTAYTSNAHRMARSDEAYRLFFLSQDMKAERERQKSQLLEWAHQILVRYYWDVQADASPGVVVGLGSSQFGLWLDHKASMLFEGAPEIGRIQGAIANIETELLPQLKDARGSHDVARALIGRINRQIDEIKALLGSMFDRFIEAEDGRDNVTRLLNRRYVASVARHEIAMAQRQGTGFALLTIDIDHFARIGQTLGLEASDVVLSQVAEALLDSVRAGDFVFRIGDDQFLVLLVEVASDAVMAVADGLRQRIGATPLRVGGHASTTITVSIGVAVFDGHPDYQRLLDRADEALRRAKAEGRDRCVQAA